MMTIDEVRAYALSLPYVTEDMPFDENHVTYRIGSKIFLIMPLHFDGTYICVKCDPDRAITLREQYSDITPAYHLNKKHWNGIQCEGHLSREFIKEQIIHSYRLVYNKLTVKVRSALPLSE